MANADAAFGFRPVRRLDGAAHNGAVIRCATASGDATTLGVGDPVVAAAAGGVTYDDYGQPNQGATYPLVTRAAATAKVWGVVVSVEPNRDDLTSKIRAASSEQQVMVQMADTATIFEIQEASGGSGAIANIGLNADFVVTGAASASTGYSGVELSATQATGTAQCRILGFANRPDNVAGEHVVWEVKFNESAIASGGNTGVAGI